MMRVWLAILIVGLVSLLVGLMPAGYDTGWLAAVGGLAFMIGCLGVNREYFKDA